MKKGLVVLIALLLLDVSTLWCNPRKRNHPAERRKAMRVARDKRREAVEEAIKSGDVRQLQIVIDKASVYDVYSYFSRDDVHGRRALSLASGEEMKKELKAWGAGEQRSGLRKTKSCPTNIAGLCKGISSPRGRRVAAESLPMSRAGSPYPSGAPLRPSALCTVEEAVAVGAMAYALREDVVSAVAS